VKDEGNDDGAPVEEMELPTTDDNIVDEDGLLLVLETTWFVVNEEEIALTVVETLDIAVSEVDSEEEWSECPFPGFDHTEDKTLKLLNLVLVDPNGSKMEPTPVEDDIVGKADTTIVFVLIGTTACEASFPSHPSVHPQQHTDSQILPPTYPNYSHCHYQNPGSYSSQH
jgi:hypothetical protein